MTTKRVINGKFSRFRLPTSQKERIHNFVSVLLFGSPSSLTHRRSSLLTWRTVEEIIVLYVFHFVWRTFSHSGRSRILETTLHDLQCRVQEMTLLVHGRSVRMRLTNSTMRHYLEFNEKAYVTHQSSVRRLSSVISSPSTHKEPPESPRRKNTRIRSHLTNCADQQETGGRAWILRYREGVCGSGLFSEFTLLSSAFLYIYLNQSTEFLNPYYCVFGYAWTSPQRSALSSIFSNFIDIWNFHRSFLSSLTTLLMHSPSTSLTSSLLCRLFYYLISPTSRCTIHLSRHFHLHICN